jgi:hypothetical protein
MGLPARFQTTTASFPDQLGLAFAVPIFVRSKPILKPAKPPIDSLHRLPCFFWDCGARRSTLSDIELVTTFSGEKNWSSNTIGLLVLLVGVMLVSNCSKRRDKLLLIIIVGPRSSPPGCRVPNAPLPAPSRCSGLFARPAMRHRRPHSPSRLLPVWDGSIQVCAECFAAATAMVSTRKDSPRTTHEAAGPVRSPDTTPNGIRHRSAITRIGHLPGSLSREG